MMELADMLVARLGESRFDSPLADYVAGRLDSQLQPDGIAATPEQLVVSECNQVAPDGDLWLSVLESTAQPVSMT